VSVLALGPDEDVVEGPALTRAGALALTTQLRGTLADLAELIDRAKRGRVWLPLGYASWDEYCAAELAGHLPRLSVDERRATVTELHRRGHSKRAIAAGLDVADQTVRADLRAIHAVPDPTPVAPAPTTERVVDALARAGARGLTWAEAGRTLRLHHGQVSGALSALHRRGRITRTTTYRAGSAVYLHLDHAGV